MKSVKERKNDTTRMYPCDKCNRKLKSELSLKKHQELHNEYEIYSRTSNGKISFLCSDCGKGFTTAAGLRQHSFRHLGKNQFPCPDCPRTFATKVNLANHSNNIHKAMPKKNICDVCERGFKTPYLLKEHKRYHSNEKPFHCEYCEKRKTKKTKKNKNELFDDEIFEVFCNEEDNDELKSTETTSKLKLNATKLKPTTTRRKSKKNMTGTQQLYPCDKCNRKLKTEWSLKKHQELHNENDSRDQIYNCNKCNKVFEKKYDYYEHLRTHSGELPFLCTECGKGFGTAGSLKQHSFRHLNRYMFTCPDCPKTFPTKADLVGHVNTHREILKRHICDICGSRFKTPFLLKQHQRYHNNDKRFACEYCEKRFVTKDKCQRHTRIHTGEKPFKCKFCEKAYNQSNELKKHLYCHLGENVYQCQFCPLRFSTVKIVREHFLTHKNDDEETRARNLAELNAAELKGINIR